MLTVGYGLALVELSNCLSIFQAFLLSVSVSCFCDVTALVDRLQPDHRWQCADIQLIPVLSYSGVLSLFLHNRRHW